MNKTQHIKKLLLVRNDNVGDLICSIPAIQLVRENFPDAKIHLLVNSYNSAVVNPLVPKWVDQLIIYQKTKHVGFSLPQLIHLFKFYSGLRKEHYDTVVLLVGGHSRQAQSFADWTGASRIVGYGPENEHQNSPLPAKEWEGKIHEVEYSWKLATHLCGIEKSPPPEISYPIRATGTRIAIQITSRKPGNRWDAERFVELARKIHEQTKEKPLLLWSPGDLNMPTHPGDDEKAADIIGRIPDIIEPHPTATLEDLVSVLKECRTLITPDGGAMHLAAAMGIRIVAMFGQSDPIRWKPWTPHAKVLQSSSRTIQDISVDEVLKAFQDLSKDKI